MSLRPNSNPEHTVTMTAAFTEVVTELEQPEAWKDLSPLWANRIGLMTAWLMPAKRPDDREEQHRFQPGEHHPPGPDFHHLHTVCGERSYVKYIQTSKKTAENSTRVFGRHFSNPYC